MKNKAKLASFARLDQMLNCAKLYSEILIKNTKLDTKNIGLRDIEVADTKISDIDGEHGKLIYRGYDILDLTKNSSFEETAYLLLNDDLPTRAQLDAFKQELIGARDMPR